MNSIDHVAVAYVHEDTCTMSWHHSMYALYSYAKIAVEGGTNELSSARNSAVQQFLELDQRYMFWIDTDMGFAPDLIERLYEAAEANELLAVGALCFTINRGLQDGMNGHDVRSIPTIYDWRKERDGFEARLDFEEDALIRCDATGSAAILIHRSAFERVQHAEGKVWYERIRNQRAQRYFGEDLSFCLRLRKLGIPIHVLTAVEASHAKTFWVSTRQYRLERMSSLEDKPDATNGQAFNMLAVR